MKNFAVPGKNDVNQSNQEIFNNLENGLGFIPNLYATFAYSDTALKDYLNLQNRKSTLKAKEREIINLVVSQVNECAYCLAAHTALGKMNGFNDEQILEIRRGRVPFNEKYDALAQFVQNITINRSKPGAEVVAHLFDVGYDEANLVDIIMVIGDKLISNFLHGTTKIPVDFPAAPALEGVVA